MKKILIFLPLLVLSLCLNAQSKRQLANFTKVKVAGNISAELIKADRPSVEFKMTKGDVSDLITNVDDGKLYVKIKSNKWGSSKAAARVKIYYTNLEMVKSSAGSSVRSDVIVADRLDLDASSGSSLKVEIEANDVTVDCSSGASIRVEGDARKVIYDASSGASVNAYSLTAKRAKVDVSSGATVKLHASESLTAEASSGGSVKYKGDPEVDADTGWSGQIKKADY